MPLKKKGNNKQKETAKQNVSQANKTTINSNLASILNTPVRQTTIGPDTRTADEKETGQAMFIQRKKQEEAAGADFTTPAFIQQQKENKRERLEKSLTVELEGAY